jgi:hypothetical protein
MTNDPPPSSARLSAAANEMKKSEELDAPGHLCRQHHSNVEQISCNMSEQVDIDVALSVNLRWCQPQMV